MDSTLVTVLLNAGVAGIVVILMIGGWLVPKPTHDRALEDGARKDAEIEKLQEALALERQRSNDVSQAGMVTNQLIQGLLSVVSERGHDAHGADGRTLPVPPRPALDLTGGDIGL